MRWLFRVIFLGGAAYLLALIEGRASKPDHKVELLLEDEIGFESEFAYLTELLERQLQAEVRLVGGARGKTVSFETDDELIARLSFHKDRHIFVRLSDYHYGLQAWFSAAFPGYKVRFQPLKPVATTKQRHKTPRGR